MKKSLAVPAEISDDTVTPCAHQFVSIAGTMDPVAGYLLGKQLKWAYMDLNLPPGDDIVDREVLIGNDPASALEVMMLLGARAALNGEALLNDPHSWSQYILRNAQKLQEALLTRIPV